MKMAMTAECGYDEAETQRQQVVRAQQQQALRAELRGRWGQQLLATLRHTFVLLGIGTIALLLIANGSKLRSLANQKMNHVIAPVQGQAKMNPLRQQALEYEQQVNEIVAN